MLDNERQRKLAKVLVNYSVKCQKGEKVWIDARECDMTLTANIIREVYAAGGYPFLFIEEARLQREILKGADEEYIKILAKRDAEFMSQMDCYIGIRGGNNSFELSDVDKKTMAIFSKEYLTEVHYKIRVNKTKWVILRYPTEGMSQLASMSTEAFEDYYFDVCTLDYAKMDKAMDSLKALMEKTDKVRILAKDTDLTFSIKGIPAIKCAGEMNIPDGEVYTAPVKNSVNGRIHYNVPSIENGYKFEDVCLDFKDGKIVNISANDTERATAIFNTDEGARYVGEFAFGVNPFVTKAIGDILFDEKISGSIHFTPGECYEDAPNGNESAIHWDLVLVQTEEYGGGEIWMDDVLVRKNGRFVLPELECLNPENLK